MKKNCILSLILMLFIITGCGAKLDKKIDTEDKITNSGCCPGCQCGDTIELLKTTETAWTLTEIDENGEYVYNRHSFINFHGTGENRFAFFKNDENANPISELRGTFSITRNADITLTPDNETTQITCKLGEEKNLIAIMYCDNDFGTFTLQKMGTIELSSVIKETLFKTKSITIKNGNTITNEKDIEEFIKIVSDSKIWTGPTTLPSPKYELDLLDSNNSVIANVSYNPDHYFTIDIGNRGYSLTQIDKASINKILDKYN